MTKNTNEVIIDGADVSECQHLENVMLSEESEPYFCDLCYMDSIGYDFGKYCKNNPNCYFKQLQQLKKENEKYKKRLEEVRYIAFAILFDELESFDVSYADYQAEYLSIEYSKITTLSQQILDKINEVLDEII